MRALYRRKRDTILPALLEAAGSGSSASDATFFLWLAVDERRRRSRGGCSSTGILVAPGSFFGPAGEGYAARARPDAGGVRARRRDPRAVL